MFNQIELIDIKEVQGKPNYRKIVGTGMTDKDSIMYVILPDQDNNGFIDKVFPNIKEIKGPILIVDGKIDDKTMCFPTEYDAENYCRTELSGLDEDFSN